MIAEAWDAAGLYQVGHFPGYRWAEWNGRYRDDVRRFVKGDAGLVGAVAARIAGSADIYQASGHLPINSVNFITCHDGFTLNDLVSYNEKHNEANGEGNRDGIDDNLSWNCGVEGPTDDPAIEALRSRQIKNFAAILLLSQGVPMFAGRRRDPPHAAAATTTPTARTTRSAGSTGRSSRSTPTCCRFFQQMIALPASAIRSCTGRASSPATHERARPARHRLARLPARRSPGWDDSGVARARVHARRGFDDRAGPARDAEHGLATALDFELPPVPDRRWHRAIDTAQPSPDDIAEPGPRPASGLDATASRPQRRRTAIEVQRDRRGPSAPTP